MRFQLDPRGSPVERPGLPAPAATDAPAAAPSAPAASSLAASSSPSASAGDAGGAYARRPSPLLPGAPGGPAPVLPRPRSAAGSAAARRKTSRAGLLVLVGVLLLGAGVLATLYVLEMPPFEYPRRYMLEGDEEPAGMRLAELPSDMRQELGIEENPGRIDPDRLAEFGQGPAPTPAEGWAQVLRPDRQDAPVIVMALRFDDEDDARSWAGLLSTQCSRGGGALLRDGDVAVLIAASGTAGQAYLPRVLDAFRSEVPDAVVLCP